MLTEPELLRLILDQLDEYAIFTMDKEGLVTRAYHGVANVLGYAEEELIGQPGSIIFTDEDQKGGKPETEMEMARQLGKTINERWHIKKDRTKFWASGFMFHLHDKSGKPIGFLKIIRDITGRKRAEEHIQTINSELEQRVADRTVELNTAIHRLEGFCYTVAHDLRAPLRQMSAFAELVHEDEGDKLSKDSKDHLKKIEQAAAKLDKLITDLLNYSRISQMAVMQQHISLSEVVQRALHHFQSEIRGKSGHITIEEPLPIVKGEMSILEQVVTNLLSNALKFVAPGVAPKIRIFGEEKGSWARLWIEDNGIGIPSVYHNRIFTIFERLHDSTAYEGTGVGLAIVSSAIQRLGGKVGIDSESNKGSRFWIELPVAQETI